MVKKLLNYFGSLIEYRFPALMLVAAVGLALGLALLRFSEFLFDVAGAGEMPWALQKAVVSLCFIVLALPTLAMFQFFRANKNWVLAHRFQVLVFAGWMGVVLAFDLVYYSELFIELIGVEKIAGAVEKFVASLWVIVLGLPTVGMLWFFRTNDTLEQIQKTKESTDVNILFGAQKMMFEDDGEKPGTKTLVGFAQLMRLRQQGSHRAEIDLVTCNANLAGLTLYRIPTLRGANLAFANLQGAFLIGVDLTNANLQFAEMGKANMDSANLQGAIMTGAKLQNTVLHSAQLQGADLAEADLSGALLQGAKYSDETILPIGFETAVAKDMVKVP